MAKWSTAKWGGIKEESLPDSAYRFLIKDKSGNVKTRGKVVGRKWKPDGKHRYHNFMDAVYAFWNIIDSIFWDEMDIYIEHEGKPIVQIVPYKSDWEIYRIKFNTPPALTNDVIYAINNGLLKKPRHMFL